MQNEAHLVDELIAWEWHSCLSPFGTTNLTAQLYEEYQAYVGRSELPLSEVRIKMDERQPTALTVLVGLDTRAVASRPGTAIELTPPVRHSNTSILDVDRPYEGSNRTNLGSGGITYATVLPANDSYMMWYSSSYSSSTNASGPSKTHPTAAQHNYSFVLALSGDGIRWSKPNLGLVEEDGNTNNNILLRGQDLYGASVVIDEAGKQNERFKMVYWAALGYWDADGQHGGHHMRGGMWTATSPDGIHWTHSAAPVLNAYDGDQGVEVPMSGTKQPQQCVLRGCCTCYNLPQTVSDVQALTYDPVRKGWSVYHKMWMDGPDGTLGWRRAAGHSFTTDFNDWSSSHAQYVMTPDEEDAPPLSRLEDQSDSRVPSDLHGVAVHYHAASRLYIGRLMVLYTSTERGGAEVLQQELVTSYDGRNFDRPFRTARGSPFFVARNPNPGAFDHAYVFAGNGNGPTDVGGDEERLYYSGLNGLWSGHETLSGVGFVTMKRDRYAMVRDTPPISSDTPAPGGQITLRPIDVAGRSTLTLNVRTNDSVNASIAVELLTHTGWRLPSFTREECEVIGRGQDSVSMPIRWRPATVGQPAWTLAEAGAAALKASNSSEVLVRVYLRSAELYAVGFT